MKILSLETSCDETAVAVLEVKNGIFNLKSNIVSSQIKIHSKYGGIVPEVAARKQLEMVIPIIERTCQMSNTCPERPVVSKAEPSRGVKCQMLDYIAVTAGPGLISSLIVGIETAKTLSYVWQKPLVAVNHLEGHIYSNFLPKIREIPNHKFQIPNKSQITNSKLVPSKTIGLQNLKIKFPLLCLVVSGGHTLLVLMKEHLKYRVIGETFDDAAGECFDKVAKILKLGYPGGPIISKLATYGNPYTFDLPRPMINQNNFDFSFSGLKTAVLYTVRNCQLSIIKGQSLKNICASFQQAVIDVLVTKTIRAAKKYHPQTILLSGGVAANKELRKQLGEKVGQELPKVKFFMPELKFTTDNAAMIAAAAYFKIRKRQFVEPRKLKADPNLTL